LATSALIVTIVTAVFVLAELTARWWIRHRTGYFVFPPGLRIRHHPNRELFPELERVVRFEINSDGERGSEVPTLAAGETLYRALVVGGSQPEGYLLDQDTCWPAALQRILAEPRNLEALGASRVHVGNIGRSGVGAEALQLLLERALPRYPRLQAIVILVGASDVLRWLEQGAPAAPASSPRIADIFRCHPQERFGWTIKTLAMLELARRARRRRLRPVSVHEGGADWIGAARAMRARAKVIRATVPDPAPMLDHFDACLRRVVELARAHADRVVIVRQSWFAKDAYTPDEAAHMWHGGAGQAWREEVSIYYSLEVTNTLMSLLDERAERAAREMGVEQIDLPSLLEPSLRTFYDFFHLTPEGSKTVAGIVAQTVLRTEAAEEPEPACAGLRAS